MVKSAKLLLIGSTLLLLGSIRSAEAAEIKIVSPSEYEDLEGEVGVENCCPPFRYQQVFPAEDFAALGNQPHWIIGFTWRPDQSVTHPLTVQLPDQEVRLSTTEWGPDSLSLQFDDNLGADVTEFYRGPMIAVADAHSGPGPRHFYHVDFPAGVTPYLFDPNQGNLLFDVKAWQGEAPARGDMIPGIQTSLYAEPPIATQGDRGGAVIFQFTFVPVILGDYNHNGILDAADIDDLTIQIVGGTNPASYDLNADALVDAGDIKVWVGDLFHSWIGDANLDGQFNSSDLVTVLVTGTYELDVDSVWSTGDFNGDGRTNSGDLVAALADGGYEMGPHPAVASVPEPTMLTLLVMAVVTLSARRRSSVS